MKAPHLAVWQRFCADGFGDDSGRYYHLAANGYVSEPTYLCLVFRNVLLPISHF
jgi:hypothetical protein